MTEINTKRIHQIFTRVLFFKFFHAQEINERKQEFLIRIGNI